MQFCWLFDTLRFQSSSSSCCTALFFLNSPLRKVNVIVLLFKINSLRQINCLVKYINQRITLERARIKIKR